MVSLYKNGRARSYILIILALLALLLSAPVKKMINRGVNERAGLFASFLKDNLGLSITYETLSPSILSSFYIRNIKIYDEEKNVLLTINKTRINYSLMNVLRRNLQKGISSITVDGIDVDIDEMIKLAERIQGNAELQINYEQLKRQIPGNIKLKNVNLEYADENYTTFLGVKTISLSNPDNKNTMDFQASVNFTADVKTIKQNFSGKMDISGSFTEHFNDSQLNVKLRDLTNGDYKINKLNFHASYSDGIAEIHTIQAVNPISFGCFYDFRSSDLNLQVRMEKLRPVSVISANSRQQQLKKLKNLSVDTNTIVKCNVKEKTLNFISDTKAFIPQELFPGGMNLSMSVFGDEHKAELTDFTIDGQRCTAASKLSYIYDTQQLSGYIEVPEFILDNGNVISTELYFDPLDKGFMAFSPQIFIGPRALTALQFTLNPQDDSYDFNFEVYDYSHPEEAEPGALKIDGSFLKDSKYIQTNITLNSIYLDGITNLAGQFLPENQAQQLFNMSDTLYPYLISGDVYASTDLKTFSYNVPYVILANSTKDNQALMFAVNGTDRNIQLNELSFIMGKYSLEATASLDRAPDSSDMFFSADINADSVPYHFSGSFMPEVCTITGDYGTDVEIHFDENNEFNGHVNLRNLPLKLMGTSLIVTTESNFSYDTENGPQIQLSNLEIEEAGNSISSNPKVVMSGNATRYGAAIDSIAYTDLYSVLQGSADVMLNVNNKVFDSLGIMLNLRNPFTEEGITIDGSISNPDHVSFTKENIVKNIYMNLQMQMKNFSLNRFVVQKNDNNLVTGMVYASGTLEHPYLSLNLDSFGLLCAADMLTGNGNIVIEDRDLTVNDLNVAYTNIKINNIQAQGSLTDMWFESSGDLNIGAAGKSIHSPLHLSIGNAVIPEGSSVPDYLTATLTATELSGSLMKKSFPASISLIYANNVCNIFSSDNIGINGTYNKDGILELTLDNKSFLTGKIGGLVNFQSMNLEIYDFMMNLPEAFKYMNIDELMLVETGVLTADFVLTGSVDDPDINGSVNILSPAAKLPLLTKQRMFTSAINISVINNEFHMPETIFFAKNNQRLAGEFTVLLNKWSLDHIEASLKTYKNDQFHVNLKTSEISLDANLIADLDLFFENNVLEVNGKISGENVDAGANLFALSNLTSSSYEEIENPLMIIADLDISLGTHASVQLDPVIRCVFVPNTNILININQPAGSYMINGALNLKSGDLSYLNRNFYIKSGAIKFNKNDITNPIITLNAETREKDDNQQTVKIILSVEDQYLKNLQPKFSSVPPKSETEIRGLLGQIVLADSDDAVDLIFAASDYALQSTIMRQAENKLRELLNFDIFSVRTNVLKNTYNLSVSRNLTGGNISIGNFLDNTTVYIGKYLGTSLYVDAMLHLSYENGGIKTKDSSDGVLTFQPEIGMELESPFANIRINMAPDLNALLKNQFVPSTSVTLSWKFTY